MPAILSRAFTPALRRIECSGLHFVRMINVPSRPNPSTRVIQDPRGFLKYERNISRDPNALNPQLKGDRARTFFTRRLGHAFEAWPLFGLMGFWFCMMCYVIYTSSQKIEVWFDRSQSEAPWAWEKVRDKYYKMHTLLFDPKGVTHQRLEIMERIQDDMLEAAKKRAASQH